MIAVDTNLLVYAHRADAEEHQVALEALTRLADRPGGWAIPMPCVHEFLAVVTGAAFGPRRTPMDVAFDSVLAWTGHPSCSLLSERDTHLGTLHALCLRARLVGAAIHDARIAAICLDHGVEELWTCDRDFARFPDLVTRNPLIPSLHEPAGSRYRALVPAA